MKERIHTHTETITIRPGCILVEKGEDGIFSVSIRNQGSKFFSSIRLNHDQLSALAGDINKSLEPETEKKGKKK